MRIQDVRKGRLLNSRSENTKQLAYVTEAYRKGYDNINWGHKTYQAQDLLNTVLEYVEFAQGIDFQKLQEAVTEEILNTFGIPKEALQEAEAQKYMNSAVSVINRNAEQMFQIKNLIQKVENNNESNN